VCLPSVLSLHVRQKNFVHLSVSTTRSVNLFSLILLVLVTFIKYFNIYPTRCKVTQFIFIWKLLYIFRVVVPPPILRSANNCIYSIWYLSHRNCCLPLSWKSWNWFECAVGGVRHSQHTQTSFNSSTIAADSSNANNRCCRYSCFRS